MKIRYLFIAAIIAGVAGYFMLDMNRQSANKLLQAVDAKDAAGGDTAPEQAALSNYVRQHMGTSSDVFLKASYDRAVQAAAAAVPRVDGRVYRDAQAACASRADSVSQARCVQTYLSTRSQPAANPQPLVNPEKAKYMASYKAPGWTPDGAGLALLSALTAAVLGLYLLLIRLIFG